MTVEQINAMPAGVALDREIARVIAGPELSEETSFHYITTPHLRRENILRQFSPSTDWADAMFAADKFGLFEPGGGIALAKDGDGESQWWWVFDVANFANDRDDETTIAMADTGPLAISRAILNLKVAK